MAIFVFRPFFYGIQAPISLSAYPLRAWKKMDLQRESY